MDSWRKTCALEKAFRAWKREKVHLCVGSEGSRGERGKYGQGERNVDALVLEKSPLTPQGSHGLRLLQTGPVTGSAAPSFTPPRLPHVHYISASSHSDNH